MTEKVEKNLKFSLSKPRIAPLGAEQIICWLSTKRSEDATLVGEMVGEIFLKNLLTAKKSQS